MEVNCAVKLANKDQEILPSNVRVARIQAHKIKKSQLLQSSNHKAILSGTEHEELFLVDGPGLHKGAIPHMFWRAVEVIPETSLCLSPEFPITTGVGSFLEMIGIDLSESPPTQQFELYQYCKLDVAPPDHLLQLYLCLSSSSPLS
jgi:hypothetical protein